MQIRFTLVRIFHIENATKMFHMQFVFAVLWPVSGLSPQTLLHPITSPSITHHPLGCPPANVADGRLQLQLLQQLLLLLPACSLAKFLPFDCILLGGVFV